MKIESEKVVSIGKGVVSMDWTKENATSILCQTMFDEALRLRNCFSRKERNSIRKFLIVSFQILTANNQDIHSPEVSSDDTPQ